MLNTNNKNFKKGFTLIEVLLVIVLVGILLAIGLTSINIEARFVENRNDTRKTHIKTIEGAIAQYRLQEGSYPAGLDRTYREICDPDASACVNFVDLKAVLVPKYLQAIPQDPNDKDSTGGAGYSVAIDTATNTVSVRSLGSESDVTISVNDPLPAEQTVVTNSTLAATVPGTPPSSIVNFNITDSGLYGQRFVGYYADSVSFFDTASKHGDTSLTSQINSFSSSADNYSWQWVGYFKAPTTGSYTFFTSSDDASHLWIGSKAVSGFTTANATVNNGGLHATIETSGTVSLTAGQYYPIRIMFGESGGGDIMTVSFSGPSIAKTTDGTGYFFGGQYFWDTYIGDINGNINNMVTNGLVLYLDAGITASYPGTGTTWFDLSGNNNNGTLLNGVGYNSANGGSLVFDGSNDYVNINSSSLGSSAGTICFWMMSNTVRDIYNTHSGAWNQNTLWGEGGLLSLRISNGTGNPGDVSISSSVVFDNNFHFVCTQWTTGGERSIWVDGNKLASLNNTLQYTPSSNLELGYKSWSASFYSGRMYVITSYNRSLTTSEIQQNFNFTKSRFGL